MNKEALLKKIKAAAKQDADYRKDPRFLQTMGFLVAKGFLQTNFQVARLPNHRLKIEDALWAGRNVEPRILEVLPAAILRLENHFDLNNKRHPELAKVVDQLRRQSEDGDEFEGIAYEKIKTWASLPLSDRRTKLPTQKKVTKTFRLTPQAVAFLKSEAQEKRCSETDVLEACLLGVRSAIA